MFASMNLAKADQAEGSLVCAVCARDELVELFQRSDYCYSVCHECSHAQISPPPSDEALREFYERSYFQSSSRGGYADYQADESLHRLNALDRLQRLRRAGATSGRLLDIGCAAGYFLDEARATGWQVIGQDVSSWARETAGKQLAIEVVASVAGLLPTQAATFDCVTLFQVLEHVVDPRVLLCQVHQLLKPGGVVVVETWRRDSLVARVFGRYWQQVSPPSVLHLFTKKSAIAIATETGFGDIQYHASSKVVSAPFVGNLLAKKHPLVFAPLGWLTSRWPLKNVSARYGLGDLVTMTAKKW